MGNFNFLSANKDYTLFSSACIEAERVFASSANMCATACRRALELAVKWLYSADSDLKLPYKDNLSALVHETTFKDAVPVSTWGKIIFIIKLGNIAVHSEKKVKTEGAVTSLAALFEFVDWIDYCYGADYTQRAFSEAAIPKAMSGAELDKVKEQMAHIVGQSSEKDSEIEALREQIEAMQTLLAGAKKANQEKRHFVSEPVSEFETRKIYIDVDLTAMGWTFGDSVREEVEVDDMAGIPGQKGYADYVLYGRDGLPLAVVEAKRTSKDPNIGRKQAVLYADALEDMTGRRPMMFLTNGFETYFWDDQSSPQRAVSGVFSRDDLEKLMTRRSIRKNPADVKINDEISGRYYQKEAIRAVTDAIEQGHRKALLVMATGTGKTRTASGLTDVLSRGGVITNVLFLADRTALVTQAKDAFRTSLPDMSLCNLLSGKDDKNARIVFSTYPTMLNAIDNVQNDDGGRLYTPAHFDLIIVDEAHRSIFKKYRAIFEYFDAIIVGLTATPRTDVDRNTYDFFEMEHGVPTFAYDYETAVHTDHVLVPFYNIETSTKFLEEGIVYDDLSDADKERYEDDFAEDDDLPDIIPSNEINEFIFNAGTVDMVLQNLMERGIKVSGGDKVGKSIIFAQNKRHAAYIVERFDKLYPQYRGGFAQQISCDINYAQTIIDDFKQADKNPQIAVSVDMMDTGIDIPEVANLIFFKKIRSKTKFWQMIGRGTRLCPEAAFVDYIDGAYLGKRRFFIFDYLGNFEYFRLTADGVEGKETMTLSELIFVKRVRLMQAFQDSAFADRRYQDWRGELLKIVHAQICALNPELISVKLQLRYVEKFKLADAFTVIGETDRHELVSYIAPLVYMDDDDEQAKRFDNLMYGLMLADIETGQRPARGKRQLINISRRLLKKITIPQVNEKIELIRTVQQDEFWDDGSVYDFEKIRIALRDLIKFIVDDADDRQPIFTDLTDEATQWSEAVPVDAAYDFEDYRLKVNRYIEEHRDHIAIYKLRNNIRMEPGDYQALSNIFTGDLGSESDYRREYRDLPFGLLVRKVAKLERAAAMEAFSEFIDDRALNQQQIVFVTKIIEYIIENGYLEDLKLLTQPPFDKPQSFVKLFNAEKQKRIIQAINRVKDNAVLVG
jgi:type I restriction enzyme R subunit